jgi:hypothetical protein
MSDQINQPDEFGFLDSTVLETEVPGYFMVTTWRSLLLSYRVAGQAAMLDASAEGKKAGEAIVLARQAGEADEEARLNQQWDEYVKSIESERDRLSAEERACEIGERA